MLNVVVMFYLIIGFWISFQWIKTEPATTLMAEMNIIGSLLIMLIVIFISPVVYLVALFQVKKGEE